jgi:hypothetical protein
MIRNSSVSFNQRFFYAPLLVRNVLRAGLAMLANAGSLVLRVAGQVWPIVRDKLLTMVSFGAYQPATVIAR